MIIPNASSDLPGVVTGWIIHLVGAGFRNLFVPAVPRNLLHRIGNSAPAQLLVSVRAKMKVGRQASSLPAFVSLLTHDCPSLYEAGLGRGIPSVWPLLLARALCGPVRYDWPRWHRPAHPLCAYIHRCDPPFG